MPDATRRQEPRCTASQTVNGMTIQITVRLPDEQVRFLDRQVAARETKSRVAAVRSAPRASRRSAEGTCTSRCAGAQYLACRTRCCLTTVATLGVA